MFPGRLLVPPRRADHPQLACQAIATCWYATARHDPADAEDHRGRAPWYKTKTEPSTADMAAKLRRVIIAARDRKLVEFKTQLCEESLNRRPLSS